MQTQTFNSVTTGYQGLKTKADAIKNVKCKFTAVLINYYSVSFTEFKRLIVDKNYRTIF